MLTEAYVAGLTQENARKLIDRAHELNLPASVVRTVDGGFIVPAALVEDPKPEPEPAPDEGKAKRTTTRKAAAKTQSADDSTADAVASEE